MSTIVNGNITLLSSDAGDTVDHQCDTKYTHFTLNTFGKSHFMVKNAIVLLLATRYLKAAAWPSK